MIKFKSKIFERFDIYENLNIFDYTVQNTLKLTDTEFDNLINLATDIELKKIIYFLTKDDYLTINEKRQLIQLKNKFKK